MLTGLNNNGLYDINNINKKGMYGNMRDDTGEQTSDRYKRAGTDQEGTWAKIELGTNKLYKYRKYDVHLLVKKSWRLRSGVSEIDILKALLSARCLCEETRVEPFCNKCHAPKVVCLDTAKNTQKIKADRGEYEVYTCVISSKCSSSRDHLHASLVLTIEGYPFTKALTSTPFGLFSREKKSEKRQENFNVSTANNISTNNTISQSLHLKDFFSGATEAPPEYSFTYNEASQTVNTRGTEGFRATGYLGYEGITSELSVPATNQNRGTAEFFCNNGGFVGFPDTTQTMTAVAMPAEEALENTTMYDYGSYQQGFQSYAEADYISSRGQEVQAPQTRDQYQPPIIPSEVSNESGDDFRYMMPEFFVASIQQRYYPSGPPPGDPEVVGTGEGAPDPADCL